MKREREREREGGGGGLIEGWGPIPNHILKTKIKENPNFTLTTTTKTEQKTGFVSPFYKFNVLYKENINVLLFQAENHHRSPLCKKHFPVECHFDLFRRLQTCACHSIDKEPLSRKTFTDIT